MGRALTSWLLILWLFAHPAWTQQGATRVFIFNYSGGGRPFVIQLVNSSPIRVGSRSCVLINSPTDTLRFIIDGQSQAVSFEPGKTYYFIVNSDYGPGYTVAEVTERVFWLSAHINQSKGLTEYTLDSPTGARSER